MEENTLKNVKNNMKWCVNVEFSFKNGAKGCMRGEITPHWIDKWKKMVKIGYEGNPSNSYF